MLNNIIRKAFRSIRFVKNKQILCKNNNYIRFLSSSSNNNINNNQIYEFDRDTSVDVIGKPKNMEAY